MFSLSLPLPCASRRLRSFTLIELMVVVAILGILMAIAVYGVLSAIESGRIARAKQTIQQLVAGIDGFETRWNRVPPVSLEEFNLAHDNVSGGIETLLLCLRSTRGGEPLLDVAALGDALRNIDGDSSPEAYQFLEVDGTDELFELVDPWGNPYVYIPAGYFQDEDTYHRTYTYMDGSGMVITIDPQEWARGSQTGTMPQRFMLWSFGPNGVNEHGFGDDIISWTKGDGDGAAR